jgi:hypothetical protein
MFFPHLQRFESIQALEAKLAMAQTRNDKHPIASNKQ